MRRVKSYRTALLEFVLYQEQKELERQEAIGKSDKIKHQATTHFSVSNKVLVYIILWNGLTKTTIFHYRNLQLKPGTMNKMWENANILLTCTILIYKNMAPIRDSACYIIIKIIVNIHFTNCTAAYTEQYKFYTINFHMTHSLLNYQRLETTSNARYDYDDDLIQETSPRVNPCPLDTCTRTWNLPFFVGSIFHSQRICMFPEIIIMVLIKYSKLNLFSLFS